MLRTLNLAYNNFTGELPEGLGRATGLVELDLQVWGWVGWGVGGARNIFTGELSVECSHGLEYHL